MAAEHQRTCGPRPIIKLAITAHLELVARNIITSKIFVTLNLLWNTHTLNNILNILSLTNFNITFITWPLPSLSIHPLCRSLFLPYRLTPHLISVNWNVGKSIGNSNAVRFSAVIQLGTGHKGSQRMKHETAVNAVKKLLGTRSDIQMDCVVMYKQAWYQPWSKLCAKTVNMEDINQAISPAHRKRRWGFRTHVLTLTFPH